MNELKSIRNNMKISQVEAAKLLGISRRTYQKYEQLESNNDDKYQYLVYKFHQLNTLDEEHGTLKIEQIKDIVSKVLKNYEVKSCYLFGSYAKGYATERSDVDLLIDSDITGLDYYGLIEELRTALKKKVDLLTLKSLSNNPEMLMEIIKDGIKIYE